MSSSPPLPPATASVPASAEPQTQNALGAEAEPFETAEIRALLHPSEPSRLALAVAGALLTCALVAALLVAAGQAPGIAILLGVLLLFLALIWLGLQIHRAMLLGHCVRVTGRSLPELQDALDQVRAQLSYDRPVDIYVAAKLPAPAITVSYLGTRMVLVEGSLIGDLLTPDRRGELTFLLARFIGAFKARHMRLEPVELLILATRQLRFMNVFLHPYYRATAYSGDQIGLACCGDLRTALMATERLMTGKDAAASVEPRGVIDQAAVVSRRLLPRFGQLFSPEPHLTNRYLNLLFYAKAHQPAAYDAFLETLDERTARGLDALCLRSPHADHASPRSRRARPNDGSDALLNEWDSDAGVIVSAIVAFAGGALLAASVLTQEGGLDAFDTVILALDAFLLVGLLVGVLGTILRRAPVWVVLTALFAAAVAGWSGVLPVVDSALNDFVEVTLSTWLLQGAALAAGIGAIGLSVSHGRMAALLERAPTKSSRLWALMAVGGGALIAVASLLPVYDVEGAEQSLWEAYGGITDAIAVALGVAVIGVAAAAASLTGRHLPWLAALIACTAFWYVFTPGDLNEDFYSPLVGWWLIQAGGAVALVCGLIGWASAGAPPDDSPAGERRPSVSDRLRAHGM